MTYTRPPANTPSVTAGVASLSAPERAAGSRVHYLAGGTTIMYRIAKGFLDPNEIDLVDLADQPHMREVSSDGAGLDIGAMVTLADLLCVVHEDARYRLLRTALEHVASPQIRTRATIGGHIASSLPFSHILPVLLVFDSVLSVKRGSESRQIAVAEATKTPYRSGLASDELIESVHVPAAAVESAFYWVDGDRSGMVRPKLVLTVARLAGGKVRVSAGGSTLARRVTSLEEFLPRKAQSVNGIVSLSEDEVDSALTDESWLTAHQRLLIRRLVPTFLSIGES